MSTYRIHLKHIERGFTIVETLVAIAIILIAIIGPFTTIERALIASYIARDELIGNSLAQEGVEYVQGVRDDDYLYDSHTGASVTFLGGLNGMPNGIHVTRDCFNNTCTVDPLYAAAPVTVCPTSSTCPPLNLSAQGNYTQVNTGVPSRFTRSINLCYMEYSGGNSTCNPAGPVSNEVQLTVTVTWITEGQPYKTVITEYLQNWL